MFNFSKQATASIFYDKLRDECLNSYGELMEGFLNERSRVNVNKPFYDDFDFDYYHHIASREAISMVIYPNRPFWP